MGKRPKIKGTSGPRDILQNMAIPGVQAPVKQQGQLKLRDRFGLTLGNFPGTAGDQAYIEALFKAFSCSYSLAVAVDAAFVFIVS